MRRSIIFCLVGLTVGVLLCVLAFLNLGRFITVDSKLGGTADAIVVLGGETRGFYRTRHGLDLFHRGIAPIVVFSGGTMMDAGLACSSAQLSLEAAEQLGLPRGTAVIAPEARSTYDEAYNLRKLAQDREWHSLVVVTSPFHTRRTRNTFRKLLPKVTVLVSAALDPGQDPDRWWGTEHGLIATVNETLKLGYYWLNYGIAPF